MAAQHKQQAAIVEKSAKATAIQRITVKPKRQRQRRKQRGRRHGIRGRRWHQRRSVARSEMAWRKSTWQKIKSKRQRDVTAISGIKHGGERYQRNRAASLAQRRWHQRSMARHDNNQRMAAWRRRNAGNIDDMLCGNRHLSQQRMWHQKSK